MTAAIQSSQHNILGVPLGSRSATESCVAVNPDE